MVYAQATPIGPWHVAQFADVEKIDPVSGNITWYNVPILRIPWTPAEVEILRDQYPQGIVILNEEPPVPPEDDNMKSTNDPNTADFELVPSKAQPWDQEMVSIPYNNGWPTGRILLWD